MAGTRLQVAYPGEHYADLLQIEAWIKDRTMPAEAQSLLCAALQRRAPYREAILDRLAKKRGITREALEKQILTKEAIHLTPDEYAELDQEARQVTPH